MQGRCLHVVLQSLQSATRLGWKRPTFLMLFLKSAVNFNCHTQPNMFSQRLSIAHAKKVNVKEKAMQESIHEKRDFLPITL